MTFAQLLAEYTKGRTLEGIVQELAARGVHIVRTNLSLMRSGSRLPPADDGVVRAIAEVCGRDPDPLVFLALVEREGASVAHAVLNAIDPSGRHVPGSLDDLVKAIGGPRYPQSAPPPKERTITVEVRVDGQTLTCISRPVEWGGAL